MNDHEFLFLKTWQVFGKMMRDHTNGLGSLGGAGTDVDVSFDFVSHETVTPVYPGNSSCFEYAFSCSKNDTHRN